MLLSIVSLTLECWIENRALRDKEGYGFEPMSGGSIWLLQPQSLTEQLLDGIHSVEEPWQGHWQQLNTFPNLRTRKLHP